ncbi:MAG: HAMP domain-containing histidine kinase [Lachnospiraceae bacterium]|nr:HAMP domain-containing histidine kinase [Lachnospiraceae bacterium]
MKKKTVVIAWIAFFLSGVCMLSALFSNADRFVSLDVTEVNVLVSECRIHWNEMVNKEGAYRQSPYPFEYAVLDREERLMEYTREHGASTLVAATAERDTIREVTVDGERVGWVIIYNDMDRMQADLRRSCILGFAVCTGMVMCMVLGYMIWIDRKVIRPFDAMKEFAGAVAQGNLDLPLRMDRGNVFGAFTESFDVMREELALARRREDEANRSKRELVAQLSHDIKTPVASIKAMSELLLVKAEDAKQAEKLSAIVAKADQIDTLVTNLFSAVMQELDRMEIEVSEQDSIVVERLIRQADYMERIGALEIPECLIVCDRLRLTQVINNIIYNSYKYADTDIRVDTGIENGYLTLHFTDAGGGVAQEELFVITEPYQRGANASGKQGSGLGLYISKSLMEKMQGRLVCRNVDGGLCVTIYIRLA